MARSRAQMISMLSGRSDLDSITCEGKADAARFNFLFSQCLVYSNTEEPYFKEGFDEYMANQDDPVAVTGATEFFYLMSGTEDLDEKLPENKFLKKFDYVDDNHIDENGNLIKWINDDEYIFVDITGREVTKTGDWDVEFSPFLDDDGNPVIVDEDEEEEVEETAEEEVAEEPPKKRRGRPKKADTEKNEEAKAS